MAGTGSIPDGLFISFKEDTAPDPRRPSLRGSTALDFLAYCDKHYRVQWVNRSVAELFGVEPESLAGTPCRDIFGGDAEYCEHCSVKGVLEEGVPSSWDRELPDGRVIAATAYPSYSDSDEPDGVLIIGVDVSEKRKTQRELERSNGTVQGLFAAAPVGIGMVVDRVMQHVNDKLCTLTGYSRKELIGNSVRMLYPSEEEYRAVGEYKYRVLERQGVCTLETQFRAKDGTIIDVLMRSAAIDPAVLEAGVLFTVLDITDQKRTQQALERALQQKEMLLREVHHRSKNNMQIISSLLNLEAERAGRVEVSEPLQKMRARIRSMALVHEKLYQSDDLECVDLADYVENLSAEVVSLHGEALEREVDAESVFVDIDFAVPFGLILNELLTNSLRHGFAPGTRGSVSISLHREAGSIHLRIRDDGHGVPEGFEVDSASGLGLRLVSALVSQLHGTISVSGEDGTEWDVRLTDPGSGNNGNSPDS
jgi:PAS domain S-box-containing protein